MMGKNKRFNGPDHRYFIGVPTGKESTFSDISIVQLYALNEETIRLVGFYDGYLEKKILLCVTL